MEALVTDHAQQRYRAQQYRVAAAYEKDVLMLLAQDFFGVLSTRVPDGGAIFRQAFKHRRIALAGYVVFAVIDHRLGKALVELARIDNDLRRGFQITGERPVIGAV